MKHIFKMLTLMGVVLFSMATFSCGNKNGETKEQKEYAKFQADSLKQCTQNERIVEAAVLGAFDRVPENNGYWKKDKVTCVYNENLKLWVGIVDYHYDRNNTYFKTSVAFLVKLTAEQKGDKAEVFYTIKQIPVSEATADLATTFAAPCPVELVLDEALAEDSVVTEEPVATETTTTDSAVATNE